MHRMLIAAAAALVAAPLAAQELPKGPKAPPPEPLPEAACDVKAPSGGEWLLGRWVAPQSRWEFTRAGDRLAWRLDQKGGLNDEFGWKEGAIIDGTVDRVSGCTVHLVAGEPGQPAFSFEGVLIDGGKIYGFATARSGARIRYVLRRER